MSVEPVPESFLIHSGLEIVYANPGFCALVDAESQDQLIGTELVDMVSSDYHSPLRDRVTRLERGDDPTFGLTVEFQTFTDQPLRAILVGSVVDWDGTERVQTPVFPIRETDADSGQLLSEQAMDQAPIGITVSDPSQPDNHSSK